MSTVKATGKKPMSPPSKSPSRSEEHLRQVNRAARLLWLASDPIRLQIIALLDQGERHVGILCEALTQSQLAVAHHLALLRLGGVIAPRRQGKYNFYGLTDEGAKLATIVRGLIGEPPVALSETQAAWEREVGTVVDDPRAWLHRPNPRFGGKRPIDLIGTAEEPELRNMIEAAKQGMFS